MIRIRKLSKRISSVEALTGIDLDLGRGAALVLAGTNGSGRSTLLAILATLVRPTSGRVEIEGIDALKEPLRVRQRIGYLGPSANLHPRLTVGEHLAFVAASRGLEAGSREDAVALTLEWVGLAASCLIQELSSGLRRQLAIAGVLLGNPPLLLLDDPMSWLDPLAKRRFGGLLEERRREGATLVLACNSFDLPAGLCDRVAFLHRGCLMADRFCGGEVDPVDLLAELTGGEQPANAEATAGSAEIE